MAKFASGKKAVAVCDRCGQKYPYKKLKAEIHNQRPNGLRVCSTCLDQDHPQLQLGRQRVTDAQSLRHPRPEATDSPTTNTDFDTQYPHTSGR